MDEQAECWLYALSAPMVGLNPHASYTAPGFLAEGKVNLVDGWGIHNRDELLEMLRMADNGHARHLSDAYWRWHRCLPSEWEALLASLTPRERTLHRFASQTAGETGPGGIRAWDLGRMGFLLRCGLGNGFIDRQESLWLHGRMVVRARHYYNHWAGYVAGFCIGRAFWNCLGNSDEELAQELQRQGDDGGSRQMMRELIDNPAIAFADLPWDLPLNLPERPASLAEFHWS